MAYPNNNPYNIVIAQTSGSSINGQYPFKECIISGSNLFLGTDANGLLTASNISPTSSVAISASYALSSSFSQTALSASFSQTSLSSSFSQTALSSSFSQTALSSSYALSASFSQTALSASFSQTALSASFSQTALSASFSETSSVSLLSNVDKINDNSTYYVTFVNNTGSNVALKTDADILSYNPANNRLTLGNTSGSLLISNDNGTNPNYIYLSSEQNAAGGLAQLQVGNPTSNTTSSFVVGQNQFIVATGQPSTGVFTSLVTNITNTTNNNGLTYNNGALIVDGGVGIGKNLFVDDNLYVIGSTFLYGDLTIYGTGSIVNISSSTVIIGDNRIQLNAGTPIQRYAGIDVFDSGSGTFVNSVTSSLLWDGLNDNWLLVSNNKPSGSTNLTQSSAIMIGGPSGSFGNESLLTVNYLPKIQSTGKNLQNSALRDDGINLVYSGTTISASNLTIQYTGSITYATGVYITYTTGSFTTITITTGSNPGVGSQVPSSPNAFGMPGQINVDNNFIYVYTNQVWKRVPLSTWLL